jgi:hypothetical protein
MYVGYLPAPPSYARFLKRIVPVVLLAMVVIAALVIRAHNNPGDGSWDTEAVRQFEGVIDLAPYAMIRVAGADSSRPVETILLVSEGKFGARDRAEPFRGQAVQVRGTILSRRGRRMLELVDGETAIVPLTSAAPDRRLQRPAPELLGSVTLRGEIIDPKCYFGAMKPGEGKAHKECATLCISGGIPPMFRTRGHDGVEQFYLVAGADGNSIGDRILPFVADSVEIDGAVERLGDLLLFKIDPAGIRRL